MNDKYRSDYTRGASGARSALAFPQTRSATTRRHFRRTTLCAGLSLWNSSFSGHSIRQNKLIWHSSQVALMTHCVTYTVQFKFFCAYFDSRTWVVKSVKSGGRWQDPAGQKRTDHRRWHWLGLVTGWRLTKAASLSMHLLETSSRSFGRQRSPTATKTSLFSAGD